MGGDPRAEHGVVGRLVLEGEGLAGEAAGQGGFGHIEAKVDEGGSHGLGGGGWVLNSAL